MRTLRLTHANAGVDRHRVEAVLEGVGLSRQTTTVEFNFSITAQDREDLRWYLEDYLQYPAHPAPQIAGRIEGRMKELGIELFSALFSRDESGRKFWSEVRAHLARTRIEIATAAQDANALPWELLRDPASKQWIALRSAACVRVPADHTLTGSSLPPTGTGRIRILLAICRPAGGRDVPFRSVATRVVKGLEQGILGSVQLDVLRPPSFARLTDVLRQAKGRGEPYHVVHFDGHGIYGDLDARRAEETPRHFRGYLAFENAGSPGNTELKDGTSIGALLAESGVPILVLNACRSAHVEVASTPVEMRNSDENKPDVQESTRAFGSLSHEVAAAGVAGVVAMRYNVYVVTAAQFVADLYQALAQGHSLGESVAMGRKQLAARPHREVSFALLPLQDWVVPLVHEVAPLSVFPRLPQRRGSRLLAILGGMFSKFVRRGRKDRPACADLPVAGLTSELDRRPIAGFFGRDETILALDRAFEEPAIVILQGDAGSGKTSVAVEFARWYQLTGGIAGPVLFTSFEQHKSLAQVLDRAIGFACGGMLEESGVHWLALTEERKRDEALKLMRQRPVLWIWDNVEPVTGFPAGTSSAWSEAEQNELAGFLRSAAATRARILITSRRDERDWLGALPKPFHMPPMPMRERLQLAKAFAERHNKRLADLSIWMPLLKFSEGNPLALTVLVSQALRDKLKTAKQINDFIVKLRAGEGLATENQGREEGMSLNASLSYGYSHSFADSERKCLSILHLFQGFVSIDTLELMFTANNAEHIQAMSLGKREELSGLLSRAAEVGLLTPAGDECYSIHPALPWFFATAFGQSFRADASRNDTTGNNSAPSKKSVERAFVEAVAMNAKSAMTAYENGEREIARALYNEEANLINALELARHHKMWSAVTRSAGGLRTLYHHTGRASELGRLNGVLQSMFQDPKTGLPLEGREDEWILFMDWHIRDLRKAGQHDKAETLLKQSAAVQRRRAQEIIPAGNEVSEDDLNRGRTFAITRQQQGNALRERGDEACVAILEDALQIFESIRDWESCANCANCISSAYMDISTIKSVSRADEWAKKCRLFRGTESHAGDKYQLAMLEWHRFQEARERRRPALERSLIEKSRQYCQEALALKFSDMLTRCQALNHMGATFAESGEIKKAQPWFRQAVESAEQCKSPEQAGMARFNLGFCLMELGNRKDALTYANAALKDFLACGTKGENYARKAKWLIDQL